MLAKLLIGSNAGEVQNLPYDTYQSLVLSGQAAMVRADDDPALAGHPGVQIISVDELKALEKGGSLDEPKASADEEAGETDERKAPAKRKGAKR